MTTHPLTEPAFEALFERHRGELQVHCYRMLGSDEDSEDLVQETFLSLAQTWTARDTWLAMSQEDLERLRLAVGALRTDTSEVDWEATLAGAWVELWDPEIEWDASTHPIPDLAGIYRGVEPTLQWWREWLAAWEAVQVDYELLEAGDRVVGLFHQRMRGHYTGIDVATGRYAMVFTFRDGLIVHAKFYGRQSDALAAVGLSESAAELRLLAEAAFGALNSGDLDGFIAVATEDVEFTSMIAEVEGTTFRGHEGIRTWWDTVVAAFGDVRWEILEVRGPGDRGVAHVRMDGTLGGIPLNLRMWLAARLREGRVTWWSWHRTEHEALEAVGM